MTKINIFVLALLKNLNHPLQEKERDESTTSNETIVKGLIKTQVCELDKALIDLKCIMF